MSTGISFDPSHMDQTNKANLKKTPDGKTVKFISCNKIVLIGDGHSPKNIAALKAHEVIQPCTGTIQVDKASLLGWDKGELIVRGCTAQRGEFEQALRRISKKKITHQ